MKRTLITILFAAGCTATVRSAPPAEPMPPPPPPRHSEPAPPPPVVAQPTPPPPAPPAPGDHPAYSHAAQALRHARALLQRPAGGAPDVRWDEKATISDIDVALRAIHEARMDDGMPFTEHPPIDNKLSYRDRLRDASKLIDEAAKDLNQVEDNKWAHENRKDAINATVKAAHDIREALADRRDDHDHKDH